MLSNLKTMHIQNKTSQFEQFLFWTHSKIALELAYFSLEWSIASIVKRSVVTYTLKTSTISINDQAKQSSLNSKLSLAQSSNDEISQRVTDQRNSQGQWKCTYLHDLDTKLTSGWWNWLRLWRQLRLERCMQFCFAIFTSLLLADFIHFLVFPNIHSPSWT
jgi:hypothetical protein